MTALQNELRDFYALIADVRRSEERTGRVILATLATPPIDPTDDDTIDAEDDSFPPPPPHRTENSHR